MTTTAMYRWEGLDAAAVASLLNIGYVEVLPEATSTLDIAHDRAARGVTSSALIVADTQHAGRGRMGRAWSSEAGRGVWCTFIECPDPLALEVLSLRVGVAVAERLDALARERVRVKWPNDLMAAAGKLGGILVEARWSGDVLGWAAIGIGVNVAPPRGVAGAAGFPPGVARIAVLRAMADGVRAAVGRAGRLSDAELLAYRERDILIGRRLVLPAAGVARGITADGALLIETAGGVEAHRTGTVQLWEDA